MVKDWLWNKREYVAIAIVAIVGFSLVGRFPTVEPWALFTGPIIVMVIANQIVYLVTRVDLLNFRRVKKLLTRPEPKQRPLAPLAERLWLAIQATLAEGKYDWRTAESLSKETGIEIAAVVGILEYDLGRRGLVVRGVDGGRYHYTAFEHYKKIRTWKSRLFTTLSDEVR